LQSGSSHDGLDADVPRGGRRSVESEQILDLKKLTPGEITTAVSGVVLLVFSFFHWYSVDLGPFGTYSRNGWQSPDSFWSIIAILIGIVLAAHVITEKLTGVDLPERLGSVGWGVVHLAGGVVAFLFILFKWLTNTDYVAFGLYVSLIAAAGLAVGGYLMAKEAGELPGALGGAKGGSAPPPTA
jgi:hypothetical protein